MDFMFLPDEEKFRNEVRLFLQTQLDAGIFEIENDGFLKKNKELSKKFAEKKWIGMTWPKKYGGQERKNLERVILMEEVFRVQAPIGFHYMSDRQIGQTIIHVGNDEQKARFLPEILNAEKSYSLLFSEPEAGSDLAALKTTAIEEKDCYIINGQKLWTSGGDDADYGWCIAKTDLKARKHNSLSEFIIDLKSPGITRRPLNQITGNNEFCEIFLDNVKVPKKNLIGQINRGFYQIVDQLVYERGGIQRIMQNYPTFERLLEYVTTKEKGGSLLSKDPLIRDRIARLETEFQAARLYCYYIAWKLDQGEIPDTEAAIYKVIGTELKQEVSDFALEVMGQYGTLMPGSALAPWNGQIPKSMLASYSYTIQGGTTEILKNIVAKRNLRLP